MLKSMRKNLKALAPALWFVIAAFIISIFAVWGGSGQIGGGRGENVLAKAGGEKISTELYVANLRQRLESLKREFSELDSQFIQQLNIPQQVLEGLIQQSLLLQTAKDMGLQATDDEIRAKIMSYPVFQREGQFVGFQEYKKILDINRVALSTFEKSLETEIVMDKVVQVLTSGVTVSRAEIWENYKKNQESVRLEYVVLETEKIELEAEPSEEEIREYFNAHKDRYRIPEKRSGSYVLFETDELKKEVELSDSELEDYYKDNASQFEEPESVKVSRIFKNSTEENREEILAELRELRGRIESGEDFAEIARVHSQDDKAAEGGDWDEFSWKTLSPEEQDVIDGLEQGEISPPVELESGAALIKVTVKTPPRQKSLDLVRDQISGILKDQKARELAERRASDLQKGSKKEKSLESAGQKLGYLVNKTGLLESGETMDDVDPSGVFSQTLFNMEANDISDPLYTFKGVGILQLERIEEPREAGFDEAVEDVKADFIRDKKKERARERLNAVKAGLPGVSLEKAAELAEAIEYKTAEEHKRGQYLALVGENTDVDRFAFTEPLGSWSDPLEYSGGYALFQLNDRKEVTEENLQENYEEQKQNLLEDKKNRIFSSFMAKIREEKGVEIKYDLYFRVNSDILSRYQKEGQ